MTNDELRDHIGALVDPQQRLFFFQRLTNPKLFEQLKQIHVFSNPPSTYTVDGQSVFPIWPPLYYLINVAATIPDEVSRLLRDIETDNPAVIFDLCQVAVSLPVDRLRTLLRRLRSWARVDGDSIVYKMLDIVDYLAKGKERASALQLGVELLSVVPNDDKHLERIGLRHIRAVSRIGDPLYDYALQRVLGSTFEHIPERCLEMLVRLLRDALGIEGVEAGRDYSSIWSQDLSKEPIGSGVKEHLAHSLLLRARSAITERGISRERVYDIINRGSTDVFRRIAVALATDLDDDSFYRLLLAQEDFFRNPELAAERELSLAHFYPNLTPQEQRGIVARIHASVVDEGFLREYFAALSGEELQNAIRDAQSADLYEGLKPLELFLEGADRAEFLDLSDRFAHDDLQPSGGEVWVGPTSPRSTEEMAQMPAIEILSYLKSWVAKPGWFQHTAEGLGRSLEPVVAMRAAEFLKLAEEVSSLDEVYVRHIISALRQKVHEPGFDIDAYVRILKVGLPESRPRRDKTRVDESDDGSSWAHVQQTIAFALSDLFKAKMLPSRFRGDAWKLLTSIVQNSDPTIEQDNKYGTDSGYGPPWQLALNSARGAGMLAIFDYARWIYALLEARAHNIELEILAPEVFKLLDHFLDRTVDPTRAIRSVFGENFVGIFAMSRGWTIARADRIFSEDPPGEAAWTAYLVHNRAYDEIYGVLNGHYESAVSKMASADFERAKWDVTAMLGIHLFTAYVRGLIDLRHSALESFVRDAAAEDVGRMLWAAGNALSADETLDRVFVDRCIAALDFVLSLYEDKSPDEQYGALSNFGIWAQSTQLPDEWRLTRLVQILKLTRGRISLEAQVLDGLRASAAIYPELTANALYEMTFGNFSTLFMANEELEEILATTIKAGGNAYVMAVKTNDRLVNMGIVRFNGLFPAKT
ncbi:MAG: hypothetical protein ABSE64_04140 [Vulcanimicrobiaceae bacterium]|jgi:hypothetical protein